MKKGDITQHHVDIRARWCWVGWPSGCWAAPSRGGAG